MGNITTTGLTSYPTTLDTSTTLIDGPAGDQIIAENVNGPTQAVIALETELGTLPKGSAADLKTRLAVALNNDGTVKSSVVVGAAVSYLSGVFTVGSAAFDQQGVIGNLTFTATVGANALTFAIKTKAASDPTATDFCTIGFRAAVLTTGTYLARTITSALSIVVPSGQALGTIGTQAARLYLCAIDNAGTVELAVYNPLMGLILQGIDETNVVTTLAVAGAANAQIVYSTTARAGVAIRVLGFIEITEAVAGTWATAPVVLQIMGVGVPRTGDVVMTAYTQTQAFATGSTAIPGDDTPPLNTEGDQYMTLPMTPTNAINILDHSHSLMFYGGAALNVVGCLFTGASSSATNVSYITLASGGLSIQMGPMTMQYRMVAGTTSTTFKIRCGTGASQANTFNGILGARQYGGFAFSSMKVTEVFV